jgi:ribonucleoside-triphosphate reductase
MKWFNEERTKYILTFPVETMAMLTDGHDIVDKEYADFTAEMWAEGHSFFCYLSDSPDSLSSCCRLRNSLKDGEDEEHNHTTHQFSMGTASVATGSKSVMTINLNRVVQNATRKYLEEVEFFKLPNNKQYYIKNIADKNKLYEYIINEITEITERVHKYQRAFNEIIKDFYNAKMLDVYSAGFISLKKQYLTVCVNGLTDAAEFLGIEPNLNDDYEEFVNLILETINKSNKKDKTRDCMYNTEFVPGENLSNKNYNWDKKDGYYVSPKHIMYSSYFFNPEDTELSLLDKMKLHGNRFVKYLDGGQAAHLNINEHLSFEQYRHLLKVASEYGCSYYTFNCKNSVCNDCGHISKDTLDVCPKCGSHNIDYLTRIIGYLKRVSSFAEARQTEEKMRYYNKELND